MARDLTRLPTPDAPSALEYKQVLLTLPSNADIDRFLWGAVLSLSFWTSWDLVGTMSQEDAAQIFKNILASRTEFNMLGVIVPIYVETLPSSMLLCDGGVYNKDDYPQLWESLPSAAKTATTLTLPDLRSKFLLGASLDYLQGSEGGSSEVTLGESEIPLHTHGNLPHSHSEVIALPSLAGVGVDVPVPSATVAAGVTGFASIDIQATGGGLPHENMPPYFAVRYAIIAKVQP